jgi:hypothetical protein
LHFINDSKTEFPEDTIANIFNKLFVWFDRKLEVITPHRPADQSLTYLDTNDESIENFLKDFGTGITKIHKQDIDIEEIQKNEDPKFVHFVKDNLNKKIQSIKDTKNISEEKLSKFTAIMRTKRNLYSIRLDPEMNLQFKVIKFAIIRMMIFTP